MCLLLRRLLNCRDVHAIFCIDRTRSPPRDRGKVCNQAATEAHPATAWRCGQVTATHVSEYLISCQHVITFTRDSGTFRCTRVKPVTSRQRRALTTKPEGPDSTHCANAEAGAVNIVAGDGAVGGQPDRENYQWSISATTFSW